MDLLGQDEINMLLNGGDEIINNYELKYYVHLNSKDFVFKKEVSTVRPRTTGSRVIEVTESNYNTITIGWRTIDGVWIAPVEQNNFGDPDPRIARIGELQRNLTDTDYMIIKHLEYEVVSKESPYNIKTLHEEREALRNEIRQLRDEL